MNQSHKRRAVRHAAGAVIDMLEKRQLLSTVVLNDNGDGTNTLKITGTNNKDNIYIFDDAVNNFIEVVDDKNRDGIADGGELTLFPDADVNVVHVDSKKGDDKVEFHGINDYAGSDRSLEIDLGDGKDSFLFTTSAAKDVPLGLPALADGGDLIRGADFNIDVRGRGGNDTVTIDLSRTSIESSEMTVQIDVSSNDDTVNRTLPDGEFEEFIGSLVRAAIVDDGAALGASVLAIDLELGGGNDTVNQHVNTLILGDSAVTINTLGQSGNDKYNDYENFAVQSGSELTVNMDLGSGKDRYKSEFNFDSNLPTVTGTSGQDEVVTNGAATLPADGGIDIDISSAARFIIHGSDGDDKLEVDDVDTDEVPGGLPVFGSAISGLFDVKVYGGDGNDLAEIDLNPDSVVNVSESGIFRGIVSGDDGNDKLRIDIVAGGEGIPVGILPPGIFSSGQFDLSMLGGPGKDTLGAAFLDLGALDIPLVPGLFGVNYGPRGGILMDGGSGTDKWDTEGNGVFKQRSLEIEDDSLESPFF